MTIDFTTRTTTFRAEPCSDEIKVGMSVFIHSHHETGEHIGWDIFDLTARATPFDLVKQLVREEWRTDNLGCFAELMPETPYNVLCLIVYDDEQWFIDSVIAAIVSGTDCPVCEAEGVVFGDSPCPICEINARAVADAAANKQEAAESLPRS